MSTATIHHCCQQLLAHVRRLTEIGEHFAQRESSPIMAQAIKERTQAYVINFHRRTVAELTALIQQDDWTAVSVSKVHTQGSV